MALAVPALAVELLPETELTIEPTTALDTDNVWPFPNSRCARLPGAARDATLVCMAAVRVSTVLPAATDVYDEDDDSTVVGVGSVICDPPLLDSRPTGPPTRRPRSEAPTPAV
jgi:hypothetical protein